MLLSVIVPVLNEENTVGGVIKSLLALPVDLEVIAVDNGSTDRTPEILREFVGMSRFTYVAEGQIRGKGAAIRAGLPLANGVYVVIQDGDTEYDPYDIVRMLAVARKSDAVAVFGSRILNPVAGISYQRYYWGGRLLTWVANTLFGVGITDEATCYKMIKRDALIGMNLQCRKFEFCPEVVAKLGLAGVEIIEVPISYNPRSMEQGKKIRWTDGIHALWCLLRWSLSDWRPEELLDAPAPPQKQRQ